MKEFTVTFILVFIGIIAGITIAYFNNDNEKELRECRQLQNDTVIIYCQQLKLISLSGTDSPVLLNLIDLERADPICEEIGYLL